MRTVMQLHHLRWPIAAAVLGAMGWQAWVAWRGRASWRANMPPHEGRLALVLVALMAVPIIGNVVLAVMVTPVAGGIVGVGVPRYFFVLMPTIFLVVAVGIGSIVAAFPRARHLMIAVVVMVMVLQAVVSRTAVWAATSTGRMFRYSLHQSFTYAAQREAADVLMEWNITPGGFTAHLEALDHLFDNTTYSVSNLEQSLDWAYMHHPGHREAQAAPQADAPAQAVVLADLSRTPSPHAAVAVRGWTVVAERRVGGPWTGPRAGQQGDLMLMLVEGDDLPSHRYSPVRNMWVKMVPKR
jgi:hypothetical protein